MPDITAVHIDAPLTNFALLKGTGGGFIADDIFPIIKVIKISDKYFVFSRDEEISDDFVQEVDDNDFANEIDWSVTNETYSARTYRLRHFVKQGIVDNADTPIDPFKNATRTLLGKLGVGVENRIQAILTDPAQITNNASPSIKWDDTSPVIEKDIDDAKEIFALASGFEPNMIIIPPAVSRVVKRDPSVRDLIKFTQNDLLVNGDLPPTIWNMKVLIPGALQNAANPGQSVVDARIWNTDDVQLLWVDPSPGIETASAGYQFSPTTQQPRFAVQRYVEPGRRGQWVEVTLINDEKRLS